ncbi:pentatricopeptide repeat-containing protein At4g21065-like [Nymphaea colorata]|nr:pentatricopeptide repeat-containing protein At4g21065-like [Nymphaea colorata]XP_031504203.1 pentatricopeptide repeat-containing protein At4g21065-like [Nymphaea colorata]XP_031504205.1 pentatricopeptide repeat-containing protein At4g21065-like [Nymphaea colorata]XP_031504206.1 pentatricopeptide repeat-containing protein At4g21065-like [Nymphaea colorata]XP_049937178.1 pentatricopeptide repeat-containing protein At4g21065-like [Nymphaea colorata]XP_049937179.1 pentatricopeptide repeat-conta
MRFDVPARLSRNHLFTLRWVFCHHSLNRSGEQRCLALLESCTTPTHIHQLLSHLTKTGLSSNLLIITKLISICPQLNAMEIAESMFFQSPIRDAFLYNTIMRGYAQLGDPHKQKSIHFFSLMIKEGVTPNKFTFPFILKACAGLLDINLGLQIHGFVFKLGFYQDEFVGNTLVHMYGCCNGGIDYACKVFDEMPHRRNPVCWSALIGGYVRNGCSSNAIELFRRMQVDGIPPDGITIVSVLSACADLGALELGKWIDMYIERCSIPRTIPLCNSLIDMFAKCGSIEDARRIFDGMPERTVVSWTAIIDGLAMHSHGGEALELFLEMRRSKIQPDDVTFIGVLSACSHAGLVEDGCRYFDSMVDDYGITPKIEHYGCMVDLFSRAGLVEKAFQFVRTMPIEPNTIIWRSLLSACKIHGKLKIGEQISKWLIKFEPNRCSNYVLLSNIYGSMSQWSDKAKVREMMNKQGIKKTPGCTLIELNNSIHEFVAGDKSHPESREIYKMLDEMGKKLKMAGYIPRTTNVLLDIDEEDKEDALHQHSEKLAIAFALLKTPRGTTIRIVKNLRVCDDCHNATRFISKVYYREIIVRDRNRFHRFWRGSCSCNDYW